MKPYTGYLDSHARAGTLQLADLGVYLLPALALAEEITMKRGMLLPHQGDGAQEAAGHGGRGAGRVLECKTCNRAFPTFQALGGHRTGHRKPKLPGESSERGACAKPKVHECSVCGVVFSNGQALGGHMRRHKGEGEASSAEKRPPQATDGLLSFDLNLPPVEDEIGFLSLGPGV